MPIKFAYLFGTLLTLIPWITFYSLRKDLRKQMLVMSTLFAFLGPLAEGFWYTKDWVSPITLTKTAVGIEDVILGFGIGGCASVIYKIVSKKIINTKLVFKNIKRLAINLFLVSITTHILFSVFSLFSFFANVTGLTLGLVSILWKRKELFSQAIIGGIITTVLTLPVYWLLFFLFPSFKETYWNYENISGILFFYIPYEDLVWWLFAGAYATILYDYWQGIKVSQSSIN